jgi:hypothetical protein
MVSAATREQLQRVTDLSGVLELLEIRLGASERVYLVNDTRDWTIGSTTFVALPFRVKLPQQQGQQAPRARLEVDNIGGQLGQLFNAVPVGTPVKIRISIVSRARPDVEDAVFMAPLSSVQLTMTQLQADIGTDDVLRAPAVMARYDQVLTPGLFEG